MPPRRRRPPRPGALADLSPLRILRQIVFLQVLYYATALILIIFAALAAGKHPNLDLLLGWESLRGDVTEGWMFGLVWMLNSTINVVFILLLISRSKLVPDFAITLHVIHLIITSVYSHSIPTYYFWWGLQVASTALMTFLGMWSCQWRELRPIYFGGKEGNAADGQSGIEGANGAAGQVETALGLNSGRGRSRTRDADGGGTYEMVSTRQEGGT